MFNVILYNKIEWSTDSGLFLYEKQDRDDKRQPGTPSGVWFKPASHPTSVIFMYSERVRVDNSHLSTNPPTDSAALCSRKTKTFSGWCHCALCAVTRWPSLLCRQDKEWPLDLGELSHTAASWTMTHLWAASGCCCVWGQSQIIFVDLWGQKFSGAYSVNLNAFSKGEGSWKGFI